jgi:multidrug efflux pump
MPFFQSNEATRMQVRAPRTFTNIANFNSGIALFVLNGWSLRRQAWAKIQEVRRRFAAVRGGY